MPLLPSLKRRKPTTGSNEQENEGEEDLSDSELDKLVGASESCHLEVLTLLSYGFPHMLNGMLAYSICLTYLQI
jgi:hypothetical protein